MYKKPEMFLFIWQNGNIIHIIANSIAHANEYAQQVFGFVNMAYVIRRPIVKRDFKEFNTVILDDIKPCDVITERSQSLIEIFSRIRPV